MFRAIAELLVKKQIHTEINNRMIPVGAKVFDRLASVAILLVIEHHRRQLLTCLWTECCALECEVCSNVHKNGPFLGRKIIGLSEVPICLGEFDAPCKTRIVVLPSATVRIASGINVAGQHLR